MQRLPQSISLILVSFFCTIADAQADPPVRIGVVAPLSGNAAHIGAEIQRTLTVLEEILSRGRLNNAYHFEFEDGKAAMDLSPTTAAKKFLEIDGIQFLISATSGETLQIGPIAQKKGALVFAVYSSHKDIKDLGDLIFRTFIDVERGMEQFADWIQENHGTPIALLTEEHVFTQGIKALLTKYLQDDLVIIEDYPIDTTDIRTILTKVRSKKPKSIYFNCAHPKTCALAVTQARELGIDSTFYSYLHIDNPEFLEAASQNANGVRFLSPPDIEASSSDFQTFIGEYKAKYGDPTNDFLVRTTYDAARSIVSGIEKVGTNPKAVATFLLSYEVQGALGRISFDKNGDIENIRYVIKEIRNGKPSSIGN